MMYEYWTPRGQCEREIVSCTEREAIDNLWVINEQNIQFRQLLPLIRRKLSKCIILLLWMVATLRGGECPLPPPPKRNPAIVKERLIHIALSLAAWNDLARFVTFAKLIQTQRGKNGQSRTYIILWFHGIFKLVSSGIFVWLTFPGYA